MGTLTTPNHQMRSRSGIDTKHGQVPASSTEAERDSDDTLASLLRGTLIIGIVFILAGSLAGFLGDGGLPSSTIHLADIIGGTRDLESAALITSGILILLLAPVVGLIYIGGVYVQRRDARFAAVTFGVLLILGVSVVIALVTRGG